MLPITTVPPDPPTYQTTELCAQAALGAAKAAGEGSGYEYGGVLVSNGLVCAYTVPVTIRDAYHVAYRARVEAPWRIVGIYHTHPAERFPVFSDDDKATAKQLGLPSWIMATDSGRTASITP